MDKKDKVQTDILMNRLMETADLHAFMDDCKEVMSEKPFCAYLLDLCLGNNLVPEHIIKKAQIDRTYGHQLFNGTRRPSRDKAIQLAFGFGMTVHETQELLRIAGKNPLYPKIKRDAAILFCLSRKMDMIETQSLLASLELTLLGDERLHG